ncbi:MAG: riboflavin biosynthesis protein RibF [Planctomycetes bacterium]|nr:riboflavin biosynthesis protein RibF [Planctomycetota bacterium]
MKVFESLESLENLEKGCVLTIGNFDGFHLGHQDIITAAQQAVGKFGASGTVVMTFDPHPVAILHPEKAPGVLTPLELKKTLLGRSGIDSLVIIKDSLGLLNLSPGDFIDQFLMKAASPKAVVEGPNFHFGYGRSGDIDTLRQFGSLRGFEVVEVRFKQINLNDRRLVNCSSSLIRIDLEDGNVKDAAAMLSRPYRLAGKTVKGRGIGRKLGFPTANIEPLKQVIPAEGVYAGFVAAADSLEEVCLSEANRPAAISIGRAKTFLTDHPLLLEAHILEDNVEDLAGKWLAIDFVDRIRSQKRFENRELLKEQISRDCKKAVYLLT